MMRIAAVAFLLVAQQVAYGQPAAPASVEQIQKLFEAGEFQQVIDAASGTTEAPARYLAALSAERLDQPDEARRLYSELSAGGDTDPWVWIGRSAAVLTTGGSASPDAAAVEEGLSAARQAMDALESAANPLPQAGAFANYQLGRALNQGREYGQAAEAFDRAADFSPMFAYAHYYAGMSYRQISRLDLMAIRLERFLELAPEAPERTRVQAIMRTVRGR